MAQAACDARAAQPSEHVCPPQNTCAGVRSGRFSISKRPFLTTAKQVGVWAEVCNEGAVPQTLPSCSCSCLCSLLVGFELCACTYSASPKLMPAVAIRDGSGHQSVVFSFLSCLLHDAANNGLLFP